MAMHTKNMHTSARSKVSAAVLLIEDDPLGCDLISLLLASLGCTVHAVASGNKALAWLAAAANPSPQAILMDVQIPGLSGCALITALRARTTAPIYVISASQPAPKIIAAADGFLLKPFDVATFVQLFDRSLFAKELSLPDEADPVLDAAVLAQFRVLMAESSVHEIYEQTAADLEHRIDLLAAAFAQGDLAEARRIGHDIKGGCGMAGAVEAARLGALVEALDRKAGDNQSDNSARILRDLRAAARRLRNMLNTEIFALPATAAVARRRRSGER